MSTNIAQGAMTMDEAAASANISTEATTEASSEAAPAPATEPPAEQTDRPEWLPEKFWSSGNGPQYEELAKSYSELEQWRMKSRDEAMTHFKDEIIAETKGQIAEGVPEAADKYEIKFQEGILPDGLEYKPAEDEPLLVWWREHCFENQLPQEKFEAGITAFLKSDMETVPDFDAEMEKLGENSSERYGNVIRWLNANGSEKTRKFFGQTKFSADLVEALEDIQSKSSSKVPAMTEGATAPAGPSEEELKKMQMEPGYINGSDPVLIKKVTEGYARLSGAR